MGNSFTNNKRTESDELCAVVDDNEFDYIHNIENQFVVIDKIENKCQWKSITKWSEISAKDNKSGMKNRNYYFASSSSY